MAEHVSTADPTPLGAIDAEHLTDVAQGGRRQQCVAQRVCRDVTVGMPGTAVIRVEQQAQQPARASGLDGMYVGTEPDANRHCRLQEAAASASSRMVAAFSSSVFSASADSPTRDLPGLCQHPLLAGRQPALLIATPQVADNLGDLVHVTGSELFQVGLVPTRPVGRLFGMQIRAPSLRRTARPSAHSHSSPTLCIVSHQDTGPRHHTSPRRPSRSHSEPLEQRADARTASLVASLRRPLSVLAGCRTSHSPRPSCSRINGADRQSRNIDLVTSLRASRTPTRAAPRRRSLRRGGRVGDSSPTSSSRSRPTSARG